MPFFLFCAVSRAISAEPPPILDRIKVRPSIPPKGAGTLEGLINCAGPLSWISGFNAPQFNKENASSDPIVRQYEDEIRKLLNRTPLRHRGFSEDHSEYMDLNAAETIARIQSMAVVSRFASRTKNGLVHEALEKLQRARENLERVEKPDTRDRQAVSQYRATRDWHLMAIDRALDEGILAILEWKGQEGEKHPLRTPNSFVDSESPEDRVIQNHMNSLLHYLRLRTKLDPISEPAD